MFAVCFLAEFEMMRKEQHKEHQEKMKSNAMDKLKDGPLTELAASLDNEGDAVIANGLDTSLMKPKQNDSGKSSISSQGHPRPLVPPGFANAAVEKIPGTKSLEHPALLEVTFPPPINIIRSRRGSCFSMWFGFAKY